MLRPMMNARECRMPAISCACSSGSSNIQPCRIFWSMPSPNGWSSRWSVPVTYPLTDVAMSQVTMPMTAFPFLIAVPTCRPDSARTLIGACDGEADWAPAQRPTIYPRGHPLMSDTSTSENLDTIRGIMKDVRTAMLTTVSEDGSLHSHPMTTQQADFDGDCWFIASDSSDT